MARTLVSWTAVFLGVALTAMPATATSHPLDPLDEAEINRAVEALRAGNVLPRGALVVSLDLAQPDKEAVLAWRDDGASPPPRRARAVVRHEAKSHIAVVDLASGEVLERQIVEPAEGQVAVSSAEFIGAMQMVFTDERFREALGKRGIERVGPDTLFCAPRTVGNFGRPEEQTRRLVKVDCFDLRDNPTNAFAAPIEGLFATVDLDSGEVIEIVDLGVVPVPRGSHSLAAADQAKLRARSEAPLMPEGFSVDDWTVSWENWRFHIGWSTHSGLLLGDVSYADAPVAGGGAAGRRSVLYEGHLSELYVPYMDATATWSYRNYFDEGDYGIGTMASPLKDGADCPQGSRYLSPWSTSVVGQPTQLENRICIFVRVTGEPTWRHQDISGQLDSRPDRDLVVRFLSTVGNYDYLFDWIFDAKGRITFRGGATGLDAVKAVTAQKLGDPTAATDTAFGPLIAPGLAGIQHDHFFSLRLDLDIDGAANRFVRDQLMAGPAGEGSARTSIWRVEQSVAEKESDAILDISLRAPSLWRLQSTERRSALGYPTSYQLVPGNNALPLADPQDSPLARAGFANHHLWVTPRRGDERFAAGEFPNQSLPGQGLPAWTAADRSLVGSDGGGEDLVLWYTMGFHHVPSSEDWPVYNVGWHSVMLKPYNFFDRNPAMDLPE